MKRIHGLRPIRVAAAFLALGACAEQAPADEESAAVREAVEAFFTAMSDGDRAAMEALIIDEGMGFALRPDGSQSAGRPLAALVRDIAGSDGETVERIWDAEVHVAELPGENSAAMATLWAPYDFWLDGDFHHCGIDAFQLIKAGGDWRIANVVYTAHSEDCPDSPLGPVAG